MDIHECAAYIKLAPSTLYQKSHHKEIPVRKHGRRLVFHKDEIDAWSASQAQPVKEKKLSKFQETKQRLFQKSF